MANFCDFTALFANTRSLTEQICAPVRPKDQVVQPVKEACPPIWHLGHSSWIFEEYLLKKVQSNYSFYDENYRKLFSSRHCKTFSRPSLSKVKDYRQHVTNTVLDLLEKESNEQVQDLLERTCDYEKQLQEDLLTHIKLIFWNLPQLPVYRDSFVENEVQEGSQKWLHFKDGEYGISSSHSGSICDSSESRETRTIDHHFSISGQLVTNKEYLHFIEDGGYQNPDLWEPKSREWLGKTEIGAPLYWQKKQQEWLTFTLSGVQPVDPDAPLLHISFFEASAFAKWRNCRLPTEEEWQVAQKKLDWGSRWEWTSTFSSATDLPELLLPSESNKEDASKKMILRGSSIATAPDHTRAFNRKSLFPDERRYFTGIRLVKQIQENE